MASSTNPIVVDLIGDSDDNQIENLAARDPTVEETIDLCEDESDVEDRDLVNASLQNHATVSSSEQSLRVSNMASDQGESDEEISVEYSQNKQMDGDVTSRPQNDEQRSRRVTYPTSTGKTRSASTTTSNQAVISLESESEDDEEDSIFDMNFGLKPAPKSSSKKPSMATHPLPIRNPYARTNSDSTSAESNPVENLYAREGSAATNPPVFDQGNSSSDAEAPHPPSPFPYPSQLTQHAKQYSDERVRFLLSFWKYGRSMTRNSYQRSKLDIVGKRVVKLALSKFPIRSIEEFACGKSSNKSVAEIKNYVSSLTGELEKGGLGSWNVAVGRKDASKFYSISEACLVALRRRVDPSRISEKSEWMSLGELIDRIDSLLHPVVPGKLTRRQDDDNGAAHYAQSSTRSVEFLQVSKLETTICEGPYIKRHMRRGIVHYELLPKGLETAEAILSRCFPAPSGPYRRSKIESIADAPKKFEGICLGVDLREGGGGRGTLHRMCNALDLKSVPYFVGSLTVGDYLFFKAGVGVQRNLLCPILVERKSVQDVAMSIYDKRWTSQKQRMYKGQYVFGYNNCRMVYIIEGNMDKETVSGNYVGARWYNIKTDGLAKEIDNLKEEGFEILRTSSVENSMFSLARWAEGVAAEIRAGTLVAQYTYEQFKQRISTIPRDADFSKMAKDHAATKRAAAQEAMETNRPTEDPANNNKKRKASGSPDEEDEYFCWKKADLEGECQAVGLPKTGNRKELIKRLRGPRPPKLWLERKKRGQFVPERHNVAGSALLVALYLHEEEVGADYPGMTKNELYDKAESLDITKNPFSGGTTQTGPYHYDGWSSMSKLLTGDPALVTRVKGERYKLTRSCNIAGFPVAKDIHSWCHAHGNCPCGATST